MTIGDDCHLNYIVDLLVSFHEDENNILKTA